MNNLAPIVLFVYNRSEHTRRTLEALQKNDLAKESVLYIFADGAKENASKEEIAAIDKTRQVILEKEWCGEVKINCRDENLGLANSVINGVTDVVNRHGKVIVLEDDIVVNTGFLGFINSALRSTKKKKECLVFLVISLTLKSL